MSGPQPFSTVFFPSSSLGILSPFDSSESCTSITAYPGEESIGITSGSS